MATICQRVELTHGQFSVVDIDDAASVASVKWHAAPRRDRRGFYAVNSRGERMHRVLMRPGPGQIVDHVNGDGLDNRRANLRVGTQSGNCVNRKTTPGSHMRGARPKKGKWQAYIKFAGKQRSLGYFNTEGDAHRAYLAEAKRLHGDWMPLPDAPTEPTR